MLLTYILCCVCLTFLCPWFPLWRTLVWGFCISTHIRDRSNFRLMGTEGKTDLQNIYCIVSFGGREVTRGWRFIKMPENLFAQCRFCSGIVVTFCCRSRLCAHLLRRSLSHCRRPYRGGRVKQVLLTCASTVFLPFAVACDICLLHLNEHVYGLMTEYGFVSTATGERPQRGWLVQKEL